MSVSECHGAMGDMSTVNVDNFAKLNFYISSPMEHIRVF